MLYYVGLAIFTLVFKRVLIDPMRERCADLEAFEKFQEGM